MDHISKFPNILCLILIGIFISGCSNLSFPFGKKIDLIESDEYVFYYPNYYDKYENEAQEIAYISKDKNEYDGGTSIGLQIQPISTEENNPSTQEECDSIASSMAQLLNGSINYSEVIEGEIHGCKSSISGKLENLNMTIESKMLWTSSSDKIYSVAASYFDDTSQSEIKDLQEAVDNFSLK